MPQEFLGVASRDCFPTVDVESSNLGLDCQGHDCLDDLSNSEDCAVVMGARCVAGHEKMSFCLAAGIGLQKVGCITVCCKDHVTCVVGHDGIRMRGRVVQEMFDLDHCVLCMICLLGGNGAQSSKHCAVNALYIIEEGADYLLNVLLILFGEGWGRVNGLRILFGCIIRGFDVGIRLMLGLCWWCVFKLDECLRYIIKHRDMDIFVDVVLVDIHSKIVRTAPDLLAFVVFFQDAGEVLNLFTANLFDVEVINAECEGYWAKIVSP
jgi:hypothetical protein